MTWYRVVVTHNAGDYPNIHVLGFHEYADYATANLAMLLWQATGLNAYIVAV